MSALANCPTCSRPLKVGAVFCGGCGGAVTATRGDRVSGYHPDDEALAPTAKASQQSLASPSAGRGYAGLAPVTVDDEEYLRNRLTYGETQTSLDDTVTLQTLVKAFAAPVVAALFTFLACLLYGVTAGISTGGFGALEVLSDAIGAGILLSLVVFVVAIFSVKIDTPLNEWSIVLDGKAELASGAYSHMREVLKRRMIPVPVAAQRVRVGGGDAVGNYLVLREGRFIVAYVSAFAYGTGLFLGWSLFRRQNAASVLGDFLAQIFSNEGRADRLLAANRTRALREAVHNAVREGIDVAAGRGAVPAAATFGHQLPPVQNTLTGLP